MRDMNWAGWPPAGWQEVAEPPPAYETLLSWNQAPPSYRAGQADIVWNEIERGELPGAMPEALVHGYMEALGGLIDEEGLSSEVKARAGRLLHPALLATLSSALHAAALALPETRPSYAQQAALKSCEVLTSLLATGCLKAGDVYLSVMGDGRSRPLVLSLASLARNEPKASHVMCKLLGTILDQSPALLGAVKTNLMRLRHFEPDGDKYNTFWDRLVRDGRFGDGEVGGAIAVEVLKQYGLSPSPCELDESRLSRARVAKRVAGGIAARALRTAAPRDFVYTPDPARQQGSELMRLSRLALHGGDAHLRDGAAAGGRARREPV